MNRYVVKNSNFIFDDVEKRYLSLDDACKMLNYFSYQIDMLQLKNNIKNFKEK